jgi:hypothetical protein
VNLDRLRFLWLSYSLGPNEGWIAVRRNRLALSVFEALPPDLAEAALNEFARMLKSGLYDDTMSIFIGPGWAIRDQLLSHLTSVPKRYREEFARGLDQRGYDVAVPGVAHRDRRPWH